MVQALSDVEETAVSKVLAALAGICELGSFQKMRIWELMSTTLGFLYHPDICFTSRNGTSRTEATRIADLAIASRRESGVGTWRCFRTARNVTSEPRHTHTGRCTLLCEGGRRWEHACCPKTLKPGRQPAQIQQTASHS
ncbi:hypothetical protein FIBSPDRAFT_287170 [Athelia psychrophila]|uniref:Phosphatase 2A Regulatory Subunit A helical domain-containing protein n=1 Tax=Athelia psychrophila TaxID=1759441 RepID=A0A167XPP5_9AGAM|nr:hypothetical protein FIBSPDRAFT_287170 [Fibularhizoctonia sp. CBS 109695]